MTAYRALDCFSKSQLARGAVLASLGVAALAWPDSVLWAAMAVAGALVLLTGALDVLVGVATRRLFRGWPLLAGHGVACAAFGLLTMMIPRVSLGVAMPLITTWVIAYGVMTGVLSLALWPMRRTRQALLGVTFVLVPVGLLAMRLRDMPLFVSLYLGAGFAAFLGVLHLAGGLWLRRLAMPRFAPTVQSTWLRPA